MRILVTVAGADAAGRSFLTWAPVAGTARVADADGPGPVRVTLGNPAGGTGGRLEFAATRTARRTASLALSLPADGTPVTFWVAGAFGRPSSAYGDAAIQATVQGQAQPAATVPVMVRVRKDADTLTAAERDRFVTALAKLNDQGRGLFKAFREMHRQQIALLQAHGAPGFLSWHRAYLLDLERELQRLDPAVALPYWRFDRPAPTVFTPEFMGRTTATGNVVLGPANLLRQWQTDGAPGITRRTRPDVDVVARGADVSSEAATLALGGAHPNATFDTGPAGGGFDEMEGDPHGSAHVSFTGWIQSPGTAPRDPLFFLLHCNVDRLWARWQWLNDRFDGTKPAAYFYRGSVTSTPHTRVGHNLRDTMWPWNGVTGGDRPPNTPRPRFAAVLTATAPVPSPTVGDMIDYQGVRAASSMNFGYDDVPFGVAP